MPKILVLISRPVVANATLRRSKHQEKKRSQSPKTGSRTRSFSSGCHFNHQTARKSQAVAKGSLSSIIWFSRKKIWSWLQVIKRNIILSVSPGTVSKSFKCLVKVASEELWKLKWKELVNFMQWSRCQKKCTLILIQNNNKIKCETNS